MSTALSTKLSEVADYFKRPRAAKTELTEDGRQFLYEQLVILRDLALCMEQELNAFRLLEADRAGRRFLEGEATDVLRTVSAVKDGNVFRPDFRRKS